MSSASFTLIEMLVALAVLLMIMAIIFEITSETGKLWKNTSGKIQSFQTARAAFDSMTRRISQATLNTYYDYFDANGYSAENGSYSGTPATYGRQSELEFISGTNLLTNTVPPNPTQITHAIFFQAPLGYSTNSAYSTLSSTLNACGYYITYSNDQQAGSAPSWAPSATTRYRFRLMQFTQSAENLAVYNTNSAAGPLGATTTTWFTSYITNSATASALSPSHLLADNVVALLVLPRKSTEDDTTGAALFVNNANSAVNSYSYDSRTTWPAGQTLQPLQMNQLPPIVHLVMFAIDEPSAIKICTSSIAPNLGYASLFQKPSSGAGGDLTQFNSDMTNFEAILDADSTQSVNKVKLNYRVYETDVAIRGAKWSQ